MSGGLSKVQVRAYKALNVVYTRCVEAHNSQQYWIKSGILFKDVKGLDDMMQEVIQDMCLEEGGVGYVMWDWGDVAKPDIKMANRVVNRMLDKSREPKPVEVNFDHEPVKTVSVQSDVEDSSMEESVRLVGQNMSSIDPLSDKEQELHGALTSLKETVQDNPEVKLHELMRRLGISQSMRFTIVQTCLKNKRSRRKPFWIWVYGEIDVDLVKLIMEGVREFNKHKTDAKQNTVDRVTTKEIERPIKNKKEVEEQFKLTERQQEVIRWYEATGDFKFSYIGQDGLMQFTHAFEKNDGYFYVQEDEAEVSLREFYKDVFVKKGCEDMKKQIQKVFGLDGLKKE